MPRHAKNPLRFNFAVSVVLGNAKKSPPGTEGFN